MLGRNWRKLATAVGLVLVGLVGIGGLTLAALYSYREFYEPAEQDQSIQGYQPARDATEPAAPAKNQPSPEAYDPHCEQPQSHDDADLCAQWAAVRTVAETNRLTRVALRLGYIGFWVAFLGGIFGFIGTALIWAAWQETRVANRIARRDYGRARLEAKAAAEDAKALQETANRELISARRAASVANEANQIAREAMHRQLRPHVYIVEVLAKVRGRPASWEPTTYFVTCSIILRNFGAAPAKAVKGFARCFVGDVWNAPFETSLVNATEVPLANIPPGHPVPLEPYTTEFPVGATYRNIKSASQSIFIEGQIQYSDWTGEEYFTNFRFACSGDDFDMNEPKFRPCSDWNDAT